MKRRLLAAALCCVMLLSLAVTVSADSAATYVENISAVTSNGKCSVSLRVNIRLDAPNDNLTFPVPLGATDIEVNNSGASYSRGSNCLEVDLSRAVGGIIGDHTVRIDYDLSGVVEMTEVNEEMVMMLTLPLISGFAYPVESMKFTVTLPGNITTRPTFIGSYQQSSTESFMKFAVNGSMITGELTSPLKDHESLTMYLQVDREMFRDVPVYVRNGNPEIIPMAVCAGLALLYWLFFLRTWPLIRIRRATPPEGVTAGEMGCRLTFAGADLTMMVFSWAQLGYVLIHLDDSGRVWLHKRMEMGNERSAFEVKVFRELFGKRRYVDGTGYQYARLCLKFARQVPGQRSMCKPRSGNIKIFRILSCGVGIFGGICLAMNISGILALQVILAVIMAVGGAVSAWSIQEGMYRIHIRGKLPLYICDGLILLWLLIGLYAGQFWIALAMVASQLLTGVAAAYGGRRSEMGRQNATQVLGLRHYMKSIESEELNRVLKNDPEFFYNMAPYAIALGVDRQFSKRFGGRKLPPCPYFVSGLHGRHTAQDWAREMREAADILDSRQRQMQLEKLTPIRFR